MFFANFLLNLHFNKENVLRFLCGLRNMNDRYGKNVKIKVFNPKNISNTSDISFLYKQKLYKKYSILFFLKFWKKFLKNIVEVGRIFSPKNISLISLVNDARYRKITRCIFHRTLLGAKTFNSTFYRISFARKIKKFYIMKKKNSQDVFFMKVKIQQKMTKNYCVNFFGENLILISSVKPPRFSNVEPF